MHQPSNSSAIPAVPRRRARTGVLRHQVTGRAGFTTSELKVNLIRTTRMPDALVCVARMLHGGTSTQVWDATVMRESDGHEVAPYRCTQHLLAAQR